MILDKRLEFAKNIALNTGAPGTFNVGDVVDTQGPTIGHNVGQNVTRDLGATDDPMWLVIRAATAFTSGGAGTAQFALVSDSVNPPSIGGTTVQHQLTPAFSLAQAAANTTLAVFALPSGSYKRYVGIQQITGAAALTGGSIDAFLVSDPAIWRAYADNVT
jgi:hypothetical protein